jgi:hypothetical protein
MLALTVAHPFTLEPNLIALTIMGELLPRVGRAVGL